jgi:hypothetical protein
MESLFMAHKNKGRRGPVFVDQKEPIFDGGKKEQNPPPK